MTFIEAYHVGIVVADLDASSQEFSELLGVTWARQQQRDLPVTTADGKVRAEFRFTYSTHGSGPALIELIEGQPGTPWWPGDGVAAAFHHVGFWDDELAASVDRLNAAGASLEATVEDSAGTPRGFAYHLLRHGPRVELVDASRRPSFQHWLAGGDFPQA
jgi:hypothetical protein